jgi:hypothetical protein
VTAAAWGITFGLLLGGGTAEKFAARLVALGAPSEEFEVVDTDSDHEASPECFDISTACLPVVSALWFEVDLVDHTPADQTCC